MATLKIVGFPRAHTSPIEATIARIEVHDDCVVLRTADDTAHGDRAREYITLWLGKTERIRLAKLLELPAEAEGAIIADERTKK